MTLSVRPARPSELRHLAAIEDSGAAPLRTWFGEAAVPALLAPAPSGASRDAAAGALLVAVDPTYAEGRASARPLGFAHLLWLAAGDAHARIVLLRLTRCQQPRGSSDRRAQWSA